MTMQFLNLINQVNSLENKVKELENNKVINKQKKNEIVSSKKEYILKSWHGRLRTEPNLKSATAGFIKMGSIFKGIEYDSDWIKTEWNLFISKKIVEELDDNKFKVLTLTEDKYLRKEPKYDKKYIYQMLPKGTEIVVYDVELKEHWFITKYGYYIK